MTPWLLVAGDFSTLGGMDRANLALASFLARRDDVELHLAAHRAWPDLSGDPRVRMHRAARPLGRHVAGMPALARVGGRWARAIARRGGRVLVNGGNCAWPDASWVHYVHAAYADDPSRTVSRRLLHRVEVARERRALQQARVVIANSERTRRDVIDRCGVAESRVHVVYYGSDPVLFGPVTPAARGRARRTLGLPADRPVAVFIGALGDRRKGFDTLFAAWLRLCRDSGWDVDLAVTGQGREAARWAKRACDAGVARRIHFLGFRDDVPDVLAASDLLVHPARYEAYGLVVHEAICRGVPAVVSRSAGVAERFSGSLDRLLLGDPDDDRELEATLRAWRADPSASARDVQPMADMLRSRSWDEMAADIVSIVEQAV